MLNRDDSYLVAGIESGMHGDIGANGSRGSWQTFSKAVSKANVGHSHSAGIYDGVYYAGTSTKMDMGYNTGLSSWSNSHVITYRNGKRAIITINDNGWMGTPIIESPLSKVKIDS